MITATETKRPTYPCKSFPYKKFPVSIPYPCKSDNKQNGRRTSSSTEENGSLSENQNKISTPLVEESVLFDDNQYEYEEKCLKLRNYPPLAKKCSYPYSRRCKDCFLHGHNYFHYESLWHKQFLYQWERESGKLICISPQKDSYEILCSIPLCPPKKEPEIKDEFVDPVLCIFCQKTLYIGGTIYDLYDKVPLIKRQSKERGDDIAYRIGIRSRVTVHKNCYDEYIKRAVIIYEEPEPSCGGADDEC